MNESRDKSLYGAPGVSVMRLAVATHAPETGACELNRYAAGIPLTFR